MIDDKDIRVPYYTVYRDSTYWQVVFKRDETLEHIYDTFVVNGAWSDRVFYPEEVRDLVVKHGFKKSLFSRQLKPRNIYVMVSHYNYFTEKLVLDYHWPVERFNLNGIFLPARHRFSH